MLKSAALLTLAVLVLGTSCDKLPNSPAASGDLPVVTPVASVATATVKIVKENGTVKVNNATVTNADIMAKNGVIHVIDTVLMPPM